MKRKSWILFFIIAGVVVYFYRHPIAEKSFELIKKVWPNVQYYKVQQGEAYYESALKKD